jgi:sarcosine dehydrogenase
MGPRSRDVLAQLTRDDVSNEALPFGHFKEITVRGAVVRATRVTFVGELGFELHVPVESALVVYDALIEAGEAHGIADAGYRAIDSLRLEKGYKNWGSDLTPNDTPLEAGHAWAVKLKSDVPFLGREALVAQKARGIEKRMATFTVDDAGVVLLGRETILRDGERVGYLASAGYGYTLEKGIGLGYVRLPEGKGIDWLLEGKYELEVATVKVPASVTVKPLYDPESKRVKA